MKARVQVEIEAFQRLAANDRLPVICVGSEKGLIKGYVYYMQKFDYIFFAKSRVQVEFPEAIDVIRAKAFMP